jgi:hypothetical protein
MFIARKTRAAVTPAPASSPHMTQQEKEVSDALQSNAINDAVVEAAQNSCGVRVDTSRIGNSCGMYNPAHPPGGIGGIGSGTIGQPNPTVTAEIGLEPKPGLANDDVLRAKRTINILRGQIASCLRSDTKANGNSVKLTFSLDVRADGVAAPTTAFPKTILEGQTETCIRSAIVRNMSGDTTAASLVFPIWVDVVKK